MSTSAWPQKLVRACQAAGVRAWCMSVRWVLPPRARRCTSAARPQGEAVLVGRWPRPHACCDPAWCSARGDQFLNLFARLQSVFPVMPLAGADAAFK